MENLEIIEDQINALSSDDLIELNNAYCQAVNYPDDQIYGNDEDFIDTFFSGNPNEALRAAHFGEYNYNDRYVQFNGYGNLISMSSISTDDLVESVTTIALYCIENQDNLKRRSIIFKPKDDDN